MVYKMESYAFQTTNKLLLMDKLFVRNNQVDYE
jgi:hypothetical protein